jgi:hypothetical protein
MKALCQHRGLFVFHIMSNITTATLEGEAVSLEFGSQIKREDLHGKSVITAQKTETIDGKPVRIILEKASLRPNGEILRTGEQKHIGVDPFGTPVEKPAAPGEPAGEPKPMKLTPASINIIPEYRIDKFLPVTTSLPPGVFETTYASARSSTVSDALLIVKDNGEGAFLLIGKKRPTIFIEETPNYDFFATENDETDGEGDDPGINF